jgi:phosphatidylinositol alpha-mannosyltransferase
MKIGLVCPYNIGRGGGVQECVLAMQAELKKRGHEVLIITPRSKEARQNPPPDTILVGAGTDVRSPFQTTGQFSLSLSPEELDNILKEQSFDVLHFHEPAVPFMSRQLVTKSRAVNVATFHAAFPDGMRKWALEKVGIPYVKPIFKYFDGFTAVSEPAAYYVRMLADKPVSIIPNGIDLMKYQQKQLPKAAGPLGIKRILYIGRLEGRKGVKHLIDAFARLDDPHVRLLIAGEGPEREKLESYVNENGVEHVKFLGFISEKRKLRLLHKSDIFCSPATHGESFGIVLLEAMASGTVTVAGNNPGYASVMKERGALSLVNPQDTEEFARRLQLLLYDKELAALWRTWALDYVKQFDYVKVVDQYEKLYKKLLK